MKSILICLLFIGVVISSCAQNSDDKIKLVDQYVNSYEAIGSYSGSILVVKDGETLLNKGFGMANYEESIPNTPETKFYLGSNSKIFTAASILLLEERGLVATTDVIQKYVDGFPSGGKITIHQLLSHTSGITYELPVFRDEQSNLEVWAEKRSLEDQITLLKATPLAAEPGTKVIYSNNNYRLLAYIIEKISGISFGDFLSQNIFRVCGMSNTGHDGTDEKIHNMAVGYFPEGPTGLKRSFKIDWSNKTGQASIYSTTGDMYKFYHALFGGKLVARVSLDKMCSPHAKSNVGTFGYGLFVFPDAGIYSFNGRSPGFSSEVRYYDRENKTFIVVLSNNYSAPVLRIMNKVASIYLGGNYDDVQIGKPVKIEDSVLDSYTGKYKGGPDFVMPNAELEVIRKENYLTILWKLGGGRESILIPQSENAFVDKTFWSTLRFEKTGDKVMRLVYTSFGKDYEAIHEE